MILNDVKLELRYYDDKKEKSQSHEFIVEGLECLDNSFVSGYGYNQDQAADECIENINEYMNHLNTVMAQLNDIKRVLVLQEYSEMSSVSSYEYNKTK